MSDFTSHPISYIKSNDNKWTVIVENECYQFDHTHPEYNGLCESVMVGDTTSFVELINVGSVIEDWSNGNFEMRDGFLYFAGEQVAAQPTNRILELIRQGWDHEPMLNYLNNLYDNVSNRAVQESYAWSSHKGLPITPDGMMIGYKGVSRYSGDTITDKNGRQLEDGMLVDKYTGRSFRNEIGDTCKMPRRQVCDDHTVGCSEGLHVGTFDYAQDWAGPGGVVVLVQFNPAHIVSVPSDCNCQKMRVSEYTVLSVAREEIEQEVWEDDDEYGDDMYGDMYDSDYDDEDGCCGEAGLMPLDGSIVPVEDDEDDDRSAGYDQGGLA